MSLPEIRRQLIELGDAQLQTLACLREKQWRATAVEMPTFERALHGAGLRPSELEALFQALR